MDYFGFQNTILATVFNVISANLYNKKWLTWTSWQLTKF